MKRILFFIVAMILIILAIIVSKFYEYKDINDNVQENNVRYEIYLNKEITGRDIATLINQAVDDNEKHLIKKDEKGKYILDDENSINIEIKITDFANEKTYTMETLYGGGMSEFVKYYGDINFKSEKVEYHKNRKISYILFRQTNK